MAAVCASALPLRISDSPFTSSNGFYKGCHFKQRHQRSTCTKSSWRECSSAVGPRDNPGLFSLPSEEKEGKMGQVASGAIALVLGSLCLSKPALADFLSYDHADMCGANLSGQNLSGAAFTGSKICVAQPVVQEVASLGVAAVTKQAVAVLKGSGSVEGVVSLDQQEEDGPTKVTVKVQGLTPGKHGFHLHQFGNLSNGCLSTGPHFNPKSLTHGAPMDSVRHAGDLGNIIADPDGKAETIIVDSQIPLSGPSSVIGRAFVVHEAEDDLGKGGVELSKSTGNAGGRMACGVVGLK